MKILFTSVGRRVELLQAFRAAAEKLDIALTVMGADITKSAPALFFCDERRLMCKIQEKEYIDELLNEMNCKDKKAECLEAYRFQKPDICLYDGVNELLERLKHNYKLGLITDGRPEGQKAKIKALGLDKYFDEIIITDELGGIDFRKPNPRAFQILAERFREEYNRMCYIGDNIHKDFIAPEMLGMEWIWFRNPDGLYSGEKQ